MYLFNIGKDLVVNLSHEFDYSIPNDFRANDEPHPHADSD